MDQDILLVLDAEGRIRAQSGAAAGAGLSVGGEAEGLLRGWPRRPGRSWLPGPRYSAIEALPLPEGGWVLWLGASRPGPAQGLRLAAWERLGSVVLHELNNALMVILGQAEMGLRAAPAATQRPLQRVQEVSQRLLELAQAVSSAVGPPAAPEAPRALNPAEQLAALLGPHRPLEVSTDAAPLRALPAAAIGLLGGAGRLLQPSAWRLEGQPEAPGGLQLRRAQPAEPGDLPPLPSLDRALAAGGGGLRCTPDGQGWRIDPPVRPLLRHALISVQEPDLEDLLIEALAPRTTHRVASLGALDAAMEHLGDRATLVVDADALRHGRLPSLLRLRARYPCMPLIWLHGEPPGHGLRVTCLPAPLQLSDLRAALERLDQD